MVGVSRRGRTNRGPSEALYEHVTPPSPQIKCSLGSLVSALRQGKEDRATSSRIPTRCITITPRMCRLGALAGTPGQVKEERAPSQV